MKFRRDPASAAWGDQRPEERAALRFSMQNNGFWRDHPILALPDGSIIDGWQRYSVALDLGIEPVVRTVDIEKRTDVRKLSILANCARRNLTPLERACAVMKMLKADGFVPAYQGRPDGQGNVFTIPAVVEAAGVGRNTVIDAIRRVYPERRPEPEEKREEKKPPPPKPEVRLKEENADLRARIGAMQDEIDSRGERLAVMEESLDPEARDRTEAVESERQQKLTANKRINALLAEIDDLKVRNRKLLAALRACERAREAGK